jgi:hypothetical protein
MSANYKNFYHYIDEGWTKKTKEIFSFLRDFIKPNPRDTIFILSPLNEYGVDCEIKHRKRHRQAKGEWEKGWNIFSQETIVEHIQAHCQSWSFYPFKIGCDLDQREDPVRTWTMKTESNDRQLTNGLKLMIDHYLIKIDL